MKQEEGLRSKNLYKFLLILLKYIPVIMSICYMLNTFLALIGIDFAILSIIAGISILTWIFLFIATLVFRFCIYHRLFLYYMFIVDIINWIDYKLVLPLVILKPIMWIVVITEVILLILLFNHVGRINKESIKNTIIKMYRRFRLWKFRLFRRRINRNFR